MNYDQLLFETQRKNDRCPICGKKVNSQRGHSVIQNKIGEVYNFPVHDGWQKETIRDGEIKVIVGMNCIEKVKGYN